MLTTKQKAQIIEEFKLNEKDTGSAEVQIALLSEEIDKLLKHLQEHKKDMSSRRGLLRMVNNRRKLLKFLKRTNEESYKKIVKEIGLEK